jgi:hypothetical protein
MPKVSLTYESGVQKGPAPDYSMLLQMKRRALLVGEAKALPRGEKGMGAIVDGQHRRGFNESGVLPVYAAKGAVLGFFKF